MKYTPLVHRQAVYCLSHGSDDAIKHFSIQTSTLRRAMRCYREHMRLTLPTQAPKILVLDIETSPMLLYSWGLKVYGGYLPPSFIVKDWNILCWSAKWLGDSNVMSAMQTPQEARDRDDKRICKMMQNLMNEANYIIAHNGDNFDIKKLNARFLFHKFRPTTPFKSIDTKKAIKRTFALSSNSLNYGTQYTLNKEKIKTDFDLWKACDIGDPVALKQMHEYCDVDMLLLEEFYFEIRGWITSHPNLGVFLDTEDPVCPNCTSSDLRFNGSYHTTSANRYESYSCAVCGAPSRAPYGVLPKDKRQQMMRPIPR